MKQGHDYKPARTTFTPTPGGTLQRAAQHPGTSTIPPLVQVALRSVGQPLDASTRAFMEPRLGHDFSKVRVHTDAQAAESASAVNALAYTVGRNIAFAAGQYAPGTPAGRRLLAHELTHVVQQSNRGDLAATASVTSAESEAAEASQRVALGHAAPVLGQVAAQTVQRQEDKNPLDQKAKAIIAKAKDEKVTVDARGIALVKDIIAEYYSADAPKVDSVVFDDHKAGTGLLTESVGSGASAKGKINVGTYYVTHVDAFARRVLQVGHEIMHIDQYRGGMAGGPNKDKREFLAFYHEALEKEKAGTGRLSYSTRLDIIDAALGYFYCLSAADQTAFANEKANLLKRRQEVNGKAGNDPVPEPTACKRQP